LLVKTYNCIRKIKNGPKKQFISPTNSWLILIAGIDQEEADSHTAKVRIGGISIHFPAEQLQSFNIDNNRIDRIMKKI